MKKPMYYINIAGVNLHNVENIHDENGRDISTYDGVGSGKFNQPDSKTPHSWKFDCELWQDGNLLNGMNTWSASEIFKFLDSLLDSTEPSRFVVTSQFFPVVNMSTLVWFKRRICDESYPGVYKATIEVEEYKPVGIKTTNIPYVTRSGKIPVPATVRITKSKTVYKLLGKLAPGYGNQNLQLPKVFKEFQTGKPVTNPCMLPNNLKVGVITAPLSSMPVDQSKIVDTSYKGRNFYDGAAESVASTFKSIGKGIENWLKGR